MTYNKAPIGFAKMLNFYQFSTPRFFQLEQHLHGQKIQSLRLSYTFKHTFQKEGMYEYVYTHELSMGKD